MKQITILFDHSLHHVCLMSALRLTFEQMPFLNRRVVSVRGRSVVMDNFVAPPPMMKNPERRSSGGGGRNLVEVSYWRERLVVAYKDSLCGSEEITAFAETLVCNYLHFRHPFMQVEVASGRIFDALGHHLLAEIHLPDGLSSVVE